MGIFGFLGKILGGGGAKNYQSPYTKEYEDKAKSAIYKLPTGSVEGASGVRQSTAGYNFAPVDSAISGYGSPQTLSQTYNPAMFDFTGVAPGIDQQQYNLQAKNVNRQGAGNLSKLSQQVGTRRPGLLAKLGQQQNRETGEELGSLGTNMAVNRANQNVALNMAQQQGNAGEQYKGYQSRSDLEKTNAALKNEQLQGLYNMGLGKINAQSGLVSNERSYRDQGIQKLMDLLSGAMGQTNQAASNSTARRGQTLNFLSSLIPVPKT